MAESTAALARAWRRFGDIDDLTEAVRSWDLDFRQLGCGRLDAEMQQVVADGMLFTRVCFDRLVEQRGAAPRGLRTFGIPGGRRLLGKLVRQQPG